MNIATLIMVMAIESYARTAGPTDTSNSGCHLRRIGSGGRIMKNEDALDSYDYEKSILLKGP